jgi:hypothetical protein
VRILLFFGRPGRLSQAEIDTWAHARSRELVERLEGVAEANLTPLRPLGANGAAEHDWLLELRIDSDDEHRRSRDRQLRDFLGDLRLLGTRPSVVVADDGEPLPTAR